MTVQLLTLREAATILRRNRESVRRMVYDKQIPGFFKLEGCWRIAESDLEQWIEERKNWLK